MTRSVYMDYNATVPVRPQAAAAVAEALTLTGNASSVHGFGRAARRLLEDARDTVAALVGGQSNNLIFTSGGSEANNLALSGCGAARILVSAGEHDSVLRAVPDAKPIPLREDGMVDLDALRRLLEADEGSALVSVMLANNETGVIQPLDEIAMLARQNGALLHCDAVQAAGKIPLDMAALGVDLLSLSAHKLGGPQGVGALLLSERARVQPLLRGGGQERRRRAGTENLPGIAGFAAAAEIAGRTLSDFAGLAALRDDLEDRLLAIAPAMTILGCTSPRLANTSCFTMPGTAAETQVMALDLAGFAVSAGSACSSGKIEPSHVLRAMGASAETAGQAIRVSLGWQSVPDDIDAFAAAWGRLYERGGNAAAAKRPADRQEAIL